MFLVSLFKGILDPIASLGFLLGLIGWDTGLQFANFILPRKKIGAVVPLGTAGHGGLWGPYKPPGPGDARSPCPAINALANHGILPRNGRGLTWRQLGQAVRHTYNISPTLSRQVPWITAKFLFNGRDWNEQMTLDDLNAHGAIEHDSSLTRADTKWQPDQSAPNEEVVRGLFETAGLDMDNLKPTDRLSIQDFANFLAYQRAYSRVFNGQYLMGTNARFFSCANSGLAYDVFGGNAADLKIWFLEERIPDNWEPRLRTRYGFTIAQLNTRGLQIELGIARAGNLESKVVKDGKKM